MLADKGRQELSRFSPEFQEYHNNFCDWCLANQITQLKLH